MKAKPYSSLKRLLNAHPNCTRIAKVGDWYIALADNDTLTEFAVLERGKANGFTYVGQVGVGHLKRLGNANLATASNGAEMPRNGIHPVADGFDTKGD